MEKKELLLGKLNVINGFMVYITNWSEKVEDCVVMEMCDDVEEIYVRNMWDNVFPKYGDRGVSWDGIDWDGLIFDWVRSQVEMDDDEFKIFVVKMFKDIDGNGWDGINSINSEELFKIIFEGPHPLLNDCLREYRKDWEEEIER